MYKFLQKRPNGRFDEPMASKFIRQMTQVSFCPSLLRGFLINLTLIGISGSCLLSFQERHTQRHQAREPSPRHERRSENLRLRVVRSCSKLQVIIPIYSPILLRLEIKLDLILSRCRV